MRPEIKVGIGCGCLALVVLGSGLGFLVAVRAAIRQRTEDACVAAATERLGESGERLARAECEVLLRPENADLARWAARREGEGSLGHDGMPRVADEHIATFVEVRRAIAASSMPACASYWDGSDPASAVAAMNALPDGTLARMAIATTEMTRAAMTMGPIVMTPEAAELEFGAFVDATRVGRLGSAMAASDAAPGDPGAACAATHALFSALDGLPPPERARTARAWMIFSLGPPAP